MEVNRRHKQYRYIRSLVSAFRGEFFVIFRGNSILHNLHQVQQRHPRPHTKRPERTTAMKFSNNDKTQQTLQSVEYPSGWGVSSSNSSLLNNAIAVMKGISPTTNKRHWVPSIRLENLISFGSRLCFRAQHDRMAAVMLHNRLTGMLDTMPKPTKLNKRPSRIRKNIALPTPFPAFSSNSLSSSCS